MATFNPEQGGVPSANMPDQTGASRGSIPDRSLEAVAEGIGAAVKGGVNLYNEWNYNAIDTQVRKGFDEVNKPYTDALPKDLTNKEEVLGALQNAFEQGKISEVYYTGQLAKLQKDLRSKYPQYEEYIDGSLMKITGIRPANAFKNAIDQAIADSQASATDEAKNWREWTEQNGDWIQTVVPGYFENPEAFAGKESWIKDKVYKAQAAALEDTNVNRNLERLAKQGQLTQEQAERGAISSLELTVSNMMDATNNTTGVTGGRELFAFLQEIQKDGEITPEEYAAATQQINTFDQAMRYTLELQLAQKIDPSDPSSMSLNAMINDAGKTKGIVDQAMAQWNTVKEYALNKEFGLFTYYSRMTGIMKDKEVNRILSQSGTLATHNALKELGTNELANQFLSETTPTGVNQDSIFAEITPEMTARTELGYGDFNQGINGMLESDKTADEKAKGVNSMIDAHINRILSPNQSKEGLANIVNSMYKYDENGVALMGKVVASERETLYKNLFQPAITEAIVASGDTELLETYYNSMLASSAMVQSFKEAAATIQEVDEYDVNRNIQYVPGTGSQPPMFVLATQQGEVDSILRSGGGANPLNWVSLQSHQKAQKAIASMNNVLAGMNPVLTGFGVNDTVRNDQVSQYIKSLGINLGEGKKDNFFGQLLKTVQSGIENMAAGSGVEETAKQANENAKGAPMTPIDDTFTFDEMSTPETSGITESNLEQVVQGTTAVEPQALLNAKTPMEAAQAFIGYDESNKDQASVLAAFIKRTTGTDINPADTAWCAAFMNAVLGRGTGKLNARSYLNWGTSSADSPQKGDVVVLKRGSGWQGHVGFYMGTNADGTIKVLAGNQGDAVSEKDWSSDDVLDFRRAS